VEHGHAKTDERNLELHRLALRKLKAEPEAGRRKALALLDRWLAMPHLQRQIPLLRRWRELLQWTPEQLEAYVLSDAAQPLRQCSPLGALLGPRERFTIYRPRVPA